MKVVTLDNIPEVPTPGAAEPTDGYSGPVHRTRQTIIGAGESANFNCSIVNFSQGCNTGWHVHLRSNSAVCFSGRQLNDGANIESFGGASAMSITIEPFRIAVEDDVLDDLKSRLRRTRWPEAELVDDWSQGTPLKWIREVCQYWAEDYDWPRREAQLNRFAQFTTEIDGLDIHFVHARSPHPEAMPLIITHGWPGSIVEFHKVIEPLTNPTAHDGSAADAFHVVCPSLPGFGFSAKPTSTGWGVDRVAAAWTVLMDRLGYTCYGAQGAIGAPQ
jgi:hypothetical protein